MSNLYLEHDHGRRWMVCESEQRWITALRRFAAELMPPPLYPMIESAELDQVVIRTAGQTSVVLYEAFPGSLPTVCQWLVDAATQAQAPNLLKLVAAGNLTDRERIVLSQLGCNMVIRHPEDLPRLERMIRGHFARSWQKLD